MRCHSSLILWLCVFASLVLLGCGFTGDVSRFGAKVLVMNNLAEPSFLDPALQTAVEDQRLSLALFEGLTAAHPQTLKAIPGVAKHWEISPDRKTYRFQLRSCRWSNGEALSAHDFLYAWRRILTPPSAELQRQFPDQRYYVSSSYADLLYVIKNAESWHRGELPDFADVGLVVHDDLRFEIQLERPCTWFLELLSFPIFAPVPRKTVEVHGRDWTKVENFVGNGPFLLAARRVGDHLRVTRNEKYWDASAVDLDGLVYLATDQVDVALDQYLAGESDWVRSFNPKKVRAWRQDKELYKALRAPEFLATYFYRFNLRVEAFADYRVRQAFSLATDRESICRYVTGLGEIPAEGIVPPCIEAFVPWAGLKGKGLAYDPECARKLLAAAGYPGGQDFPSVTIAFNSDVKNRAVAEAIQQMWQRQLGIEVLLENREKKVHYAKERAGDYQISRGSWIGDFNDPMTFLDFMRSDRRNNRTSWQNLSYDALLRRADLETDESARLQHLQRAEVLLCVDDPPILPIFHYRTAYVLRPGKYEGIFENSRNVHPPKAIRMRKP